VISEEMIVKMNRFARTIGHLSQPVAYDQVVAVGYRDLWSA